MNQENTHPLIPLVIGDIVFGKEYLLMEMWMNNSLHLRPLIIIEEVASKNGECCLYVKTEGSPQEGIYGFEKFGLIPEGRRNDWRVFEKTHNNSEQLSKMAKESSPFEYLKAIGYTEGEALQKMQRGRLM